MRIKKNDNVIVITGKDKGKTGKIARVLPSENKIIIEGINVRKVRRRARREGQQGEVLEVSMPVHVSNVQLVDPKTKKPTRIGLKIIGGKKVRVAKKSKTEI